MSILAELLKKAVDSSASDVHLKALQEPFYRIHGELVESGFDTLTPENMREIVKDIVPDYLWDT